MATPNGVVAFDAAGQSRQLRFTTNALCALEDKTGSTVLAIGGELSFGVSMATLRAMFWAGIVGGGLTLEQAGDMIDQIGVAQARSLAQEAFAAAFPIAEESDKEGGESDPPKAAG